jgi:hypothetical protein
MLNKVLKYKRLAYINTLTFKINNILINRDYKNININII